MCLLIVIFLGVFYRLRSLYSQNVGSGLNLNSRDPELWRKMKQCVWVQPKIVAQVKCLECTDADHVRYSQFLGLRDAKDRARLAKSIEPQ